MHTLSIHPWSAEGGQERGMNVEDATGKLGDDLLRQQTHIAGEREEVRLVLAQQSERLAAVWRATGAEHRRGNAGATRALERARIRPIRRDEHDVAAACIAARSEVVEYGLKVWSA